MILPVDLIAKIAQQATDPRYSAYEQAIFVAMFCGLVIWILRWQSRENKASRDFQLKQAQEYAALQAKQANDCSDLQARRDIDWRSWMEQQQAVRDQRDKALSLTLTSLVELNEKVLDLIQAVRIDMQNFRSDFQSHDRAEFAKLDEMSNKLRGTNDTTG